MSILSLILFCMPTRVVAEPVPLPAQTPKTVITASATSTPAQIEAYIRQEALARQLNPDLVASIAHCESRFRVIDGDKGTSKGVWQIHLPAWLEIYEAQANDVVWSTDWALSMMQNGKYRLWSCYKLLYN